MIDLLLSLLPAVSVQEPASPQPQPRAEPQPVEPLEGHSFHGEAFDEGPRQAAYLMSLPASVHFPITTASDLAARFFDQGVGQLHGFWYFEAERSFRQVADLDPSCAMAFWGMAMANVENEERARSFAHEAWLRREHGDDRERAHVEALARYYGVDRDAQPAAEETTAAAGEPEPEDAEAEGAERPGDTPARGSEEDRARRKRLVEDLERILFEHPDDVETKAFLVNQVWLNDYRAGMTISSRQANQALLGEIFAAQPDHPAHHYRIHLWDGKETARLAVDSAVACGPSWPSVAHMWHMGGHIFDRLGRSDDAAWQQEASARVDHAHMMRDHVLPDQIHNFAHNNEWLVRSLRQCGRVREALDLARNMIELPRHPRWNRLDKRGCSASHGRARLFGTLEQFELWDELVATCGTMYLEPSSAAGDEALRAFLLGEAHAHLGDEPARRAQVERLDELIEAEKRSRAASAERAEEEALARSDEPPAVADAVAKAWAGHDATLADLRGKRAALEALTDLLAGREVEAALARLEDEEVPREHLARLCLVAAEAETADGEVRAARVERAVELARAAREEKESWAYPTANLAHILDRAGRRDEALSVFRELRPRSARFDLELAVFQRLAPLAEAEGLPEDWRVAHELRADLGTRIDLESLGPARWSPPMAPAFHAPDAEGVELASSDLAGRPTVLILFLGFGCLHCVEQLEAFGPRADEFRAAGIEIVAIGTDAVEKLAATPGREDFSFPILADPRHTVFRAYRAYDDFEDMPLHGTFLIDAAGRERWRDVSFEPFTDAEFLLAECERLLGLPGPPAPSGAGASDRARGLR